MKMNRVKQHQGIHLFDFYSSHNHFILNYIENFYSGQKKILKLQMSFLINKIEYMIRGERCISGS